MNQQLPLWGPAPALAPVGETMKQARVRSSMTQGCVAAALGVSQSTVSRLESGSLTATVDDLVIVAQALKVPVETLLGSSPAMTRRYRWTSRPPNFDASRSLADSLPPGLVPDFVALGGSLRALRAARESRQPLTASQTAILLSLGQPNSIGTTGGLRAVMRPDKV
jgi:DNA-binding XRE family transcriptional regulator